MFKTEISLGQTLIIAAVIGSSAALSSSIESTLLKIEYDKVGGKANYESVVEINRSEAGKSIEQYKKTKAVSATNPGTGADVKPSIQEVKPAAVSKTLDKKTVAAVLKDAPLVGPSDSKTVVLEYSDLECPYCKRHHDDTMGKLKEKFGTVAFAFKSYPLPFHENAKKEHLAALVVLELGGVAKYEEFYGKIFERTTSGGKGFDVGKLSALAEEVGVSKAKFDKRMSNSKDLEDRIKAETDEGASLFGITGTPGTVFLDKETGRYEVVNGAVPYSTVESALAKFTQGTTK